MKHQSQISMVASVVMHILALLILAGVRLYKDESVEDNIPVTFVAAQKTGRLRREIPVRPMASLSESPQHHSREYYTISPEHELSVEFFDGSPEKVFSEIKSMGQEVFQDMGIQRPAVKHGNQLSRPMVIDLLNKPHLRGLQIQPRVSEGHDLLGDIVATQAKPDSSAVDSVLSGFLSAVRRKIQSRKRYPMAAQNAGIEGRSSVRMVILKDGRLEEDGIAESSGYEILDRAALQSVRNAAPFPPIPDAAKLDRIEMNIRLVFKLSGTNG